MTFGAGASVSQVCRFCRAVVVRTDRDWKNVGKAADLANTASRLAVSDRGRFRGRGFEVLGRVQLDHGQGPWDEFYVRFEDGTWGWMAEAQGNLYVTQLIADKALQLPPANSLQIEQSVTLGRYGVFKVVERKTARMLTAEGELPSAPSAQRLYADCHGAQAAFATLDYNDGTRPPELFVGTIGAFSEVTLQPRGGERPGAQKVALADLTCGACGGKLPPPKPGIERIACRYCSAISDSATMAVLARQHAARSKSVLPLGAEGTLGGTKYTVLGYCERSAVIEGEPFAWQEYLLWSESVGFRWIMCDEGNWLFVTPISPADVQVNGYQARWHGRTFQRRNENNATVAYVMGEFYWKVQIGETVLATDFINGSDVLSSERSSDEIQWSYCSPVSFAQIATAFGVAPNAANLGQTFTPSSEGSGAAAAGGAFSSLAIVVCIIVCIICVAINGDGEGGSSGGGFIGSSSSFGGFGGK